MSARYPRKGPNVSLHVVSVLVTDTPVLPSRRRHEINRVREWVKPSLLVDTYSCPPDLVILSVDFESSHKVCHVAHDVKNVECRSGVATESMIKVNAAVLCRLFCSAPTLVNTDIDR